MHQLFKKADGLSRDIIGAAIEVHREFGPGLIENIYEDSICHEFDLRSIAYKRQMPVPVFYKGVRVSDDLRLDLIVEDKVILDLKAKELVTPYDKAKVLSYLKLCDLRLGLIINFHEVLLKNGIKRIENGKTNRLHRISPRNPRRPRAAGTRA